MGKKLLKRLLQWYCVGNLAGSGQGWSRSRLTNSQSASVCGRALRLAMPRLMLHFLELDCMWMLRSHSGTAFSGLRCKTISRSSSTDPSAAMRVRRGQWLVVSLCFFAEKFRCFEFLHQTIHSQGSCGISWSSLGWLALSEHTATTSMACGLAVRRIWPQEPLHFVAKWAWEYLSDVSVGFSNAPSLIEVAFACAWPLDSPLQSALGEHWRNVHDAAKFRTGALVEHGGSQMIKISTNPANSSKVLHR